MAALGRNEEKMEEEKKKQAVPYGAYALYSVIVLILAEWKHWDGWVISTIVFGMVSCVGVIFLHRIDSLISRFWLSLLFWLDLALYVYCDGSLAPSLTMMMALVVLLSVFEAIEIHYLSIAATLIIFWLNAWVFHGSDAAGMESFFTLTGQFLPVLFLEVIEMRHLKTRLRQKKELHVTMNELSSAENGKMDFMANVSHEIRTPLNTICGIGTALLDEDLTDAVREDIQDINMASRRLMTLVSDILDFTELENDTIDIVEEPYSLSSIVMDVINMTEAWNAQKHLEIIVDCDVQIPAFLIGDGQKLYRIILNFVNNAVKFTSEGGIKLTLKARQEVYGINLGIDVEDTGIGIKEENLDKLNDVYNQVDTRRDRRAGGIGLGLAISRRMIMKMKGFMHIQSTYGRGTKVSVVLPQKYTSKEPLVSVENAESKPVLCYIDLSKYKDGRIRDGYLKCIENAVTGLRLNCVRCSTVEELKRRVQKGNFKYLFTASVEYHKDQAFFDSLLTSLIVVVVAESDEDISDIAGGVRIIRKPFHVMAVAAVMNHVGRETGVQTFKRESFIAPEARLLVVDDVHMNIKVVETLLKRYQMKIEGAESGMEAIKKVQEQHYDLIFMDHMMPEMDGVETLHNIRALPGNYVKTVPIVALTANAVGGAREMLLQEGFHDFVAKPIEYNTMERVLRKFLSHRIVTNKDEKQDNLSSGLAAEISTVSSAEHRAGSERLDTEQRKRTAENMVLEEISAQNSSGAQFKSGSDLEGIFVQTEIQKRSDSSLEQALAQIDGLNTEDGMMFCGGDLDSYVEILTDFLKSGRQRLLQLSQEWEARDLPAYTINVHSLKGMAATIGAADLSGLAKQLQFAAEDKKTDFIEEHHAPMCEKLQFLLDGLAAVLGETALVSVSESQANGQKLSEEKLPERDLTEQASSNQMETAQIEEYAASDNPDSVQDLLEQIAHAVEMFDQETLLQLVGKLDKQDGEAILQLAQQLRLCAEQFDFFHAEELLKSFET